jgi:hypothetical protein
MAVISKKSCIAAVLAATFAVPCAAELSAADLGKLGTTLTPQGAEKAGNAAGTIPAWDGGITRAPAGYTPGGSYVDPFAADKPTLTIDGKNADQYKDQLSPGQMAMLKKYPTYKMVIYPTRRSAAAPQCHYDETKQCAAVAKLAPGGNGVVGCTGGIPFPIPKDGNEAIWNHELRYHGGTFATNWAQAAVTRTGDYAVVKFEYEYDYSYGNCSKPQAQREPNKITNFLQSTTAPARLAGQILLVHETIDQTAQPRSAWTYNPGQRRVRLAPQVAYDNPGTAADGLRTSDDFGIFNGATDRYNWKLVGKKEMYIPYNSYKLSDPKLTYGDILKPGHINQDLARYELHRVWVVEATLKPGASHIYNKRVFYLDEDTWAAVVTDKYDARGDLWRFAEWHSEMRYNLPLWYGTIEVHNDLQAGRYIAMGLQSGETKLFETIKRTAGDYTPSNLRGVGTR